jgi:hypothetical protein
LRTRTATPCQNRIISSPDIAALLVASARGRKREQRPPFSHVSPQLLRGEPHVLEDNLGEPTHRVGLGDRERNSRSSLVNSHDDELTCPRLSGDGGCIDFYSGGRWSNSFLLFKAIHARTCTLWRKRHQICVSVGRYGRAKYMPTAMSTTPATRFIQIVLDDLPTREDDKRAE